MRSFFKLARRLLSYRDLRRDNGTLKTARFVLQSELRSSAKKLFQMNVKQQNLWLRAGTPDYGVATYSLGQELSGLRWLFPQNTTGLIIDAGGYIGTSSLALEKMFPEANHLSIEPSSENMELLKRNISGRNIIPIKAALAPSGKEGNIELYNRGTGEWGFTVVPKPHDRPASFIEEVETISLEKLIDRYGDGKALLVKMDIEGAEKALMEEPAWLERVSVLIIELHERIEPGCEDAFLRANRRRIVYRDQGEKFLSIQPNDFVAA